MKTKQILGLLLIALITLSLVGCQEQPKVYKVGILQLIDQLKAVEDNFKNKMTELKYTEGQNVVYVYRNAKGNAGDAERLAQELVNEKVDIIVSITTPTSIAAKKVTEGTSTPVVFLLVSDPVRAGLVESLTQPGGRVTGIVDGMTEAAGKRLELLQKIKPDMKKVLSVYSDTESLLPAEENLRQAATQLGLTLVERQVKSTDEARAAFQSIQPGEVDAIFIPADGLITETMDAITALAVRDKLPYIIGGNPGSVLAAYGPDIPSIGSQGAVLVDKILRGTAPSSLPVELAKKFNLTIDLGVAKQIGITVPDNVLSIADTVVEAK